MRCEPLRCVLAQRGFKPRGVVFLISSAILERIEAIRDVLESYSERLLPNIEWNPTDCFNVEVNDEEGDFYRFLDAASHSALLYSCVQKTIDEDLPHDTELLHRYDRLHASIEDMVDMPDSTIDLLFRFLNQNNGQMSTRARSKDFAVLDDAETDHVEALPSSIRDYAASKNWS